MRKESLRKPGFHRLRSIGASLPSEYRQDKSIYKIQVDLDPLCPTQTWGKESQISKEWHISSVLSIDPQWFLEIWEQMVFYVTDPETIRKDTAIHTQIVPKEPQPSQRNQPYNTKSWTLYFLSPIAMLQSGRIQELQGKNSKIIRERKRFLSLPYRYSRLKIRANIHLSELSLQAVPSGGIGFPHVQFF